VSSSAGSSGSSSRSGASSGGSSGGSTGTRKLCHRLQLNMCCSNISGHKAVMLTSAAVTAAVAETNRRAAAGQNVYRGSSIRTVCQQPAMSSRCLQLLLRMLPPCLSTVCLLLYQ
jgi:hypothetical protein